MPSHWPRRDEPRARRSATSPVSPPEPSYPAPRRTAGSVPTPPKAPLPRRTASSAVSPSASVTETTALPRIDATTTLPKITASILKAEPKPKTSTRADAQNTDSQSKAPKKKRTQDGPQDTGATPTPRSRRKDRAAPRRSADSPNEPGWHNVPKKDTDDDAEHNGKPPIPMVVKLIGLGLVVVVLVLAALLGLWFAGGKPSTHAARWSTKPPVQIGNFVVGDVKDESSPNRSQAVVTAQYSDGASKFVLVTSRSEISAPGFAESIGLTNPTKVGKSVCGTTADTNVPACLRIVDFTGILVAGLSGQDNETLAKTVDTVYEALASK